MSWPAGEFETRAEFVGRLLKSHRLRLGLTGADVARRCGWWPPVYRRFEKGRHGQSLQGLLIVCRALEIPVTAITMVVDAAESRGWQWQPGPVVK